MTLDPISIWSCYCVRYKPIPFLRHRLDIFSLLRLCTLQAYLWAVASDNKLAVLQGYNVDDKQFFLHEFVVSSFVAGKLRRLTRQAKLTYIFSSFFLPLVLFSFCPHSSIQNNISYILDSLQRGYDKRVRPNYGGKLQHFTNDFIFLLFFGYVIC